MSLLSQVKLVPSQFYSDCQRVLSPNGKPLGIIREVPGGYVPKNQAWPWSLERCLDYILHGETRR